MHKYVFLLTITWAMSLSLKGQHNLIFEGGGQHGDDVTRYSQEQGNAIFAGGGEDGTQFARFSQDQHSAIFSGGTDEGSSQHYFGMAQHSDIFSGGSGDGFAQAHYSHQQHSHIFNGGSDDGHSRIYYALQQHNSIFQGGGDDGADNFRADGLPAIYNPAFAVEVLDFEAWPEEDHVEIQWATASEHNHDYFLVEKSQNLHDIISMDRVTGEGGVERIQAYQLRDESPFPGRSYYRLQSVDLNGTAEISSWVEVQFEVGARISSSVYPNPSSGWINIQIKGETESNVQIDVFDLMGRHTGLIRPMDRVQGQSKESVNLSHLSTGIYILRLSDEYGSLLATHRIQIVQ